jgi:hypothetical protein
MRAEKCRVRFVAASGRRAPAAADKLLNKVWEFVRNAIKMDRCLGVH